MKKRMPGCCGLPENIWDTACVRQILPGRKACIQCQNSWNCSKDESTWHAIYLTCLGECGSVQNILDSVETGAGRIGHGIAMRGYADVQKELQKKGIGIEMCPISNLQTKAVESTKNYPMREFLNAGLKVTVNTDNRTVSNTTLTKELEFIQKNYRITDEEIHLMMRNAVDVAFADDAVKERMLKYV